MAPTTRADARKRAASPKPELDQQEATKRPRKVPAKKPKPAKAPGRNRKMEPEDDAYAEEPDEEEMAMDEEDDAGEQEQQGREEAPAARKRVAQPSRVRHTADGDREPEFHGDPFPDQEARAKWPHSYQRGAPRRPDEEEDPKARCHYRSAKVDDTVYSLNDDVYVKDDKEPQLTSRKRRKSADNDIGDKSESSYKKLNMSVQDMVKETEQMPLAQFSPSHSPLMKRARSLGQDQLVSPSSCQPAVPSQSSQCASVAQLADELEQSLDTRPEVPEAGAPA